MKNIKEIFNNIFKKYSNNKKLKDNKEERPKSLGYCRYCKKDISRDEEYYCTYCKRYYCYEHRLPARHQLSEKEKCPGSQ